MFNILSINTKFKLIVSTFSFIFLFSTAVLGTANTIDTFKPLNVYCVPGGGVAEIISATPDGNRLVYTNSDDENIGIINLEDPLQPVLLKTIAMSGEPTSTAITPDGKLAVVAVNTSKLVIGEKPVITPGKLVFVDLNTGKIKGELAVGTGPDSIAITELAGTLLAVVAIENEPIVVDKEGKLLDEDTPGQDGDISQPGLVQVITINENNPKNSKIDNVYFSKELLSSVELLYPEDPQPEFVDINSTRVAVTLQENNGVAIIDLKSKNIERIFSLGKVNNRPADLKEDNLISFSENYPRDVENFKYAGSRVADAIAWNANGTVLYTADEGELNYTGGRGWSAWSDKGEFLWDDSGTLESEAVARGHYPEGRSENKGIEIEGIETGIFAKKEFVFVGSERGSFVAVYDITIPGQPHFVQFLPTGMEPEGLLAIPERNLFLTADEASGTICIFKGVSGSYTKPATAPELRSAGVHVSWSAISGLTADRKNESVLYGIPDNALPSIIYRIDLRYQEGTGVLSHLAPITLNGIKVNYDLEGITVDTSILAGNNPGFWLASEGNAKYGKKSYMPNLLVQIDGKGNILKEIKLPEKIDSPQGGYIRKNGFEGIAISSNGRYLLAAIQRDYNKDKTFGGNHYTRIARYDLLKDKWEFFLYPLEKTLTTGDWIGLSEIVNLGNDRYAVIERDKQVGGAINLKAVYTFRLDDVTPFKGLITGQSNIFSSVVRKEKLIDLKNDLMPFEKIEGLTVSPSGLIWAALDNDGGEVESKLIAIGTLQSQGIGISQQNK